MYGAAIKRLMAVLVMAGMAGCGAVLSDPEAQMPTATSSVLTDDAFLADDGARLPLRRWGAETADAVIVALHGLNDHAGAFSRAAAAWADRGIHTYAYDQRGFGGAPGDGWQGHDVMADDLLGLLGVVRARHAGARVVVLGESIGAAIAVIALARPDAPEVDGLVLAAPAIRARTSLPAYQRMLGWAAAKLLPGVTVKRDPRGSRATDNRTVLAAMADDPKIPKGVRLDTFMGLGQAMDAATDAALHLDMPVLVLQGDKDPVIAPARIDALVTRLRGAAVPLTVETYDQGYHLLFRDLQADKVIDDVGRWVQARGRQTTPQLAEAP